MGNPYHPMKILKHLDRIHEAVEGEICPVFLQLDLTNRCNFNCEHCSSKMYADYNKYCRAEQRVERILELLDEAKEMGVKAIEITGGGEPTLFPSFIEIMENIRKNFEFALVTNGSNIHDRKMNESLVGASWLRISIDAADAEMHSLVHGIKRKILMSILRGAKAFKKMSPDTILGFSFVVTNANFGQIIDATRLARNSGFDNIRFTSYYSPDGPMIEDENTASILDNLRDAKEFLETETFKVFTFVERVRDIYKERKTKLCYYSCLVGVISATGIIYPCCAMKNMPEYQIGDIYEDSLSDIFNRQKIITTESCPYCWMDAKNDMVEYVLEPQTHINFP